MSARRLVALASVLVVVAACRPSPSGAASTGPAGVGPAPGTPAVLRGVALSPRSYDEADMTTFLSLAEQAGTVLMHAGDWAGLEQEQGNAFSLVETIGPQHGLVPVVVISASSAQALIRPLDGTTRTAYLDALRAFADRFHPPYLGVGNEVNVLATADGAGFDASVSLFAAAAATVGEVSPDTIVFPVFQYEWLVGRHGGIFGGPEQAASQWDLLSRFPAARAVGFTTYPGLVFHHPADVPADYYGAIRDHTNLPVLITETGWPSGTVAPGWDGSEEAEAAWATRLWKLLDPVRPGVVVWPFVFDTQVSTAPFGTMGLRRPDGSARPAWNAFVQGGS